MDDVRVRLAEDRDVLQILGVFRDVYGEHYPYQRFYDAEWLRRSVYSDDIVAIVAEDPRAERVLGTASIVLDIGAHTDLIGEFGRLAVHPDARGRGVGGRLMKARLDHVRDRLHVVIVENRTEHRFSQRISEKHGFVPVGLLPFKHRFTEHRECVAIYTQHFGEALTLRDNHPRIVPEVHQLASIALRNCGLPDDAVVDEDSAAYPHHRHFVVEELTAAHLPALIRIERGRLRHREIFGAMRLHYGFFKLSARNATYLLAREPTQSEHDDPVAGAIGYIRDDGERGLHVFELIARTDASIRYLFEELLERCERWGMEYVEVDVSAAAPRMQRTLIELGFTPVAYVPAMVFHEVERLDVVRMAKLFITPDFEKVQLTDAAAVVAEGVMAAITRRAVIPQVAAAVNRLRLFAGLNEEQTLELAGACEVEHFEDGSALFEQGSRPSTIYLVMEGGARVSVGGSEVGQIREGELIGELSALTGGDHSATVCAEGPLTCAVISRRDFVSLTRRRPDIGMTLYQNLAIGLGRKLRHTNVRLSLPPDSR